VTDDLADEPHVAVVRIKRFAMVLPEDVSGSQGEEGDFFGKRFIEREMGCRFALFQFRQCVGRRRSKGVLLTLAPLRVEARLRRDLPVRAGGADGDVLHVRFLSMVSR
jgi:hypothetical protein